MCIELLEDNKKFQKRVQNLWDFCVCGLVYKGLSRRAWNLRKGFKKYKISAWGGFKYKRWAGEYKILKIIYFFIRFLRGV